LKQEIDTTNGFFEEGFMRKYNTKET